jgi:integrase
MAGRPASGRLGRSKALADAARWKLIAANPLAGARLPRNTRPVPKAWDAGQLAAFLAQVSGDRLEALWRFMVVTGCRRGEAAGLGWLDLDLDRGLVTITSQRTLAGGRVVEGPVKSASGARTVALDPDTVAVLRAWRRAQRAGMMRLGVRPDTGYVFTGEAGRPLWPQWITSRFRDLCDAAGLPRIGPHGLRHSAATWPVSPPGRARSWSASASATPARPSRSRCTRTCCPATTRRRRGRSRRRWRTRRRPKARVNVTTM